MSGGKADDAPGTTPDATGLALTIGEVSKRLDLSLRFLRDLEKRGLLRPQRRGQARIYVEKDLYRIAAILEARKFGFTFAEIKDLLTASKGSGPPQSLVLSREACMRQIELLARQRVEIEEAIAELWRIYNKLPVRTAGGVGQESGDS